MALARACNGIGLVDKAESNFREAIRRNPQSWSSRSFLAQFYYRQGLYEKSAAEFEGALRLAPDNARILYSLGGVLLQLGRLDESRVYLLKAASLNPTAPVWINLGTLNAKLKRWTDATADYEKALELDQSNYQVWSSCGWVCAPSRGGWEVSGCLPPGGGNLQTTFGGKSERRASDRGSRRFSGQDRQEAGSPATDRTRAGAVPSDTTVMVTASAIFTKGSAFAQKRWTG